jgi:transposase
MPLPFQLTESQLERIKPYFPLSHGVARIDDLRVISGIVYVIRNGLPWKDAPREYGPHKTLYNRFVRWSRMGVFNRIFPELAKRNQSDRLMIDATHLKAHRTAASLHKKGLFPRCIGRTKGGLNSKLHAVLRRQRQACRPAAV